MAAGSPHGLRFGHPRPASPHERPGKEDQRGDQPQDQHARQLQSFNREVLVTDPVAKVKTEARGRRHDDLKAGQRAPQLGDTPPGKHATNRVGLNASLVDRSLQSIFASSQYLRTASQNASSDKPLPFLMLFLERSSSVRKRGVLRKSHSSPPRSLFLDRLENVALFLGKLVDDFVSDSMGHLRMCEFTKLRHRTGCRSAKRLAPPRAAH